MAKIDRDRALASRREMLAGAAVAAVGAMTFGACSGAAAAGAAVWSAEYWAKKGAVDLYMYRKRVGTPRAGAAGLPVVFLVHGSTLSGRSTFDLKAGTQDFSMMDMLARAGFDVWTMDHEGYGRSTHTESNSDIASGADDLAAAMSVVRRETGAAKFHLFGESSGALRAGLFASRHPDAVERLMLGAFTYTGIGSPTLGERAKQLEFYRTHNRRPRDRAMITSIFTRDGLAAQPEVVEKLAAEELKFGDSVPTGSYLDMTSKLPLVDPLMTQAPLLIIRGEHDGIATVEDVFDFFRKVPGTEKQFVIVPGAHSLVQGPGYRQMWHAVRAFLTTPTQTG